VLISHWDGEPGPIPNSTTRDRRRSLQFHFMGKTPLAIFAFPPVSSLYFSLVGASLPRFPYVCRARQKTSGRWKDNMYKHLTRECALTHSILIERFQIRRNEAQSARYSFIIQTDAPLPQSSGFILQSIIRTGNRKRPEWLLWVKCSSNLILLVFPANHGRSGHFDCCQILL
jgi:hypothetical protein